MKVLKVLAGIPPNNSARFKLDVVLFIGNSLFCIRFSSIFNDRGWEIGKESNIDHVNEQTR